MREQGLLIINSARKKRGTLLVLNLIRLGTVRKFCRPKLNSSFFAFKLWYGYVIIRILSARGLGYVDISSVRYWSYPEAELSPRADGPPCNSSSKTWVQHILRVRWAGFLTTLDWEYQVVRESIIKAENSFVMVRPQSVFFTSRLIWLQESELI